MLKYWQLDFFAIPITLNRKGKNKAISRHGVLLTLLFVGFIVWLIYSVSKELFVKKNPNTISYDSYIEVPAPMEINKDTFPMAFGLQLPQALGLSFFRDEEIYHPDVKLLTYRNIRQSDGSWIKEEEYTDIEVENCSPGYFGEGQNLANAADYGMFMYCIKPVQSKLDRLILEGIEDLTTYKGLIINIVKCQRSDDVTCKSDDEIKEKLTGAWLNWVYLQSAINPQNFSNPNQRFLTYFATTVTPSLSKSAWMKLSQLNVIDDDGWVFETKKTRNFIKASTPTEYFDLTPDPDGILWSGLLDLGQMYTTYERKYTRLQTVLAQIQGSATAMILALIILLHPYSQVKFNEALINELFTVKMKKNKDGSAKKKTKKGSVIIQGNEKPKERNSIQKRNQGIEIKQKSNETIGGISCLESDRALMTTTRGQEDKSPEISSPDNKLTTPHSFKTILSSIDHEADAPRVPFTQKPAQTMDMNFSIAPTRCQSDNRFNLAIEKPEKFRLAAMSDEVSQGPETPRKLSEISFNEDNQVQRISSSEEKKTGLMIETNNSCPMKALIPPLSPQDNTGAIEKQDLISLDMRGFKENNEKEPEEGADEEGNSSKYEPANINISIWEFFSSFIMKTKRTQEKFELLNKGMKNVRERMDILNIMKKFRELDKLKALLLEEDQLVLFNAIPKAEIKSDEATAKSLALIPEDGIKTNAFSKILLKKPVFIEINEKQEQIRKSYNNIQMKVKKSKIDARLLEFYHDISCQQSL